MALFGLGKRRPRAVTFYTREGCHLCEDALAVVAPIAERAGAEVTIVDITTDPALLAEFGERIPVVCIDGEPHAQWRVNGERFARALGVR